MERIQKNAIGAIIRLTIQEDGVVVDISAVTSKSLVFKKPLGTIVSKTAVFTNSGTDGKLQYVTESGFADEVGIWSVQADIIFPSTGYQGRSEQVTFAVLENL